ncbi:MAG: hypothetical protein ACRET5_19095, partial [Steroidobacteraceae bacterium]
AWSRRTGAFYRDDVPTVRSKTRGRPCPTTLIPPCTSAADCVAPMWPTPASLARFERVMQELESLTTQAHR